MYNVLVTGSSGFLGKVLVSELVNKGITASGILADGKRIDIAMPFTLPEASYDVVIHAAGKAHAVPRTAEEKQLFYDVNLEGTKNLCHAINKLSHKPKAFIFISTVAVYGKESGLDINEQHPLHGNTPYAHSKILAEQWLTQWALENDIILSILRLPLISGPNPPGNLGAMINGIKTGRYVSIGKADARKSTVWAADLVTIVPALVNLGGIYNLTDGYHPTFKELEAIVYQAFNKSEPPSIPLWLAKILGSYGDVVHKNFPLNTDKLNKITSSLTFDDTKARRLLGWKPNFVLDKLQETL